MVKHRWRSYKAALASPRTSVLRLPGLRVLELARNMDGGLFPESLQDAEGRYVKLDCVNCDKKLRHAKLYCGDYCQQFAITVRYARKAIDEGRIIKSDVQEGIGMRMLMLSGGGYPTDKRALTKQEREAILIRDRRKCQECGRKATQVDQIGRAHV